MRNKKLFKSTGFTIIEILIVLTMIGIISITLSQVLFIIIGVRSKSEVTKEVKQNGDYAYSVMEEMTRNARDVTSSCGTSTSYTILNPDGLSSTFSCTGTQIASIAASSTQYLTSTNVNVPSTSCTFSVICPTPASSPKYVYVNFTILQPTPTGSVKQNAQQSYQGTFSLRTYSQ